MKKIILLLSLIALCCFGLTACITIHDTTPNISVKFFNGEEPYCVSSIASGTGIKLPDEPTKTGYSFIGWATDAEGTAMFDTDSKLASSLSLYAVWQLNSYTVTFYANDLIVKYGDSDSQTVNYGQDAVAPNPPAIEGSHFVEWSVSFVNVTSNLEIYALYALDTITINFNNIFAEDSSISGTYGYEIVERPVPAAVSGMEFSGWYESGDSGVTLSAESYSFDTYPVSNLELYAKWRIAAPQITSLTAENSAFTYGQSLTATASVTEYDGINYTYQWLFQDTAISGQNSKVLSVLRPAVNENLYNFTVTAEREGFAPVSSTGTLQVTIEKSNLTVTAENLSATYGDAIPQYTATASGFATGDTLGSITYTCNYTATSDVGNYSIVPSGFENNNYTATYVNGTLNVSAKTLNVTANDFNVTYGDAAPSYSATADGLINGDVLGTIIYTCGYTSTSGAGSYTITPSGFSNTNYAASYIDGAVNVSAKSVTITADDFTVTYGDGAPAYSASANGLINGDTINTISYSCDYSATSNVGSYAIKPSGFDNTNYSATYSDGTITVTAKALTVTANDFNVTYGDGLPTYTATADGLANGDTLGVIDYNCGYASTSGAGTYAITPSNFTNSNYVTTYVDGAVTVSAKAVTITADDFTVIYGDGEPLYSAVASGLVNGDTLGSIIYTCDYSATSNVGNYAISASGFENANYTVTYVDGTVTVNAKAVTVTADDFNITYGDNAPSYSATAVGLINGDTLGVINFICDYTSTSSAGNYTVTPNGFTNSNYDTTYAYGTVTVGKKALTLSVSETVNATGSVWTKTYTSNTGIAGLLSGHSFSGVLATADGAVGQYTSSGATLENFEWSSAWSVSDGLSDTTANYSITYNLSVTISLNAIEASSEGYIGNYDGLGHGVTVTVSAPATGYTIEYSEDNINFAASCPSYTDVGEYTVYYRIAADYYDTITGSATVKINKTELTVTADDKSATYGDSAPAFSASYSGFVNGETASALTGALSYTCGYSSTSSVGSYDITPSGLNSSNYEINYVNGALTVTAKAVTITAGNDSVTYGDNAPAYTATAVGLINSDTLGVITYTCSYTSTGNIGSYTITPSGFNNTNYAAAYYGGTLTVNAKAVTVTADNKSITYGSAAPSYTATAEGLINGDVLGSIDFACDYTTSSGVGSYTITPSGFANANYTASYVNGAVTVSAKALTVTAANKSVTYGGAAPAYTATASGLVGSDTLGAITFTCSYTAGSNAGSYTITPSGFANSNYSASYVNGTLTVNKANYSGITHGALNGTYSPSQTLADLSLNSGYSWVTATTVPTCNITSYAAIYNADTTNYNNFSLNITVTLAKAAATLTAESTQSFDWDGIAKSVTATLNHNEGSPIYTPQQSYTVGGTYTITVSAAASTNYLAPTGVTVTLIIKSAKIGTTTYTLENALSTATSGTTITIFGNVLLQSNAEVKSGVILLLPYDSAGSFEGDGTTANANKYYADYYESTYLYRKLTVCDGLTLTVNGTLRIGGIISYPNQPNYQGHTSGAYSQIDVNTGAALNINGTLECRGYIKGDGTTNLSNGGKAYAPFVVRDFRGGTSTAGAYNDGKISPFSIYEMPNVQTLFIVNGGSTYYGYCNLYADSKYNKTTSVIIGASSGLIILPVGSYIEIKYNYSYDSSLEARDRFTGTTTMDMYGGASAGSLQMTITMTITVTVDTATVQFPISYLFDFRLHNGTFTMGNKYKLLPGAKLTVGSDATLNLTSSLIIYTNDYVDTVTTGACPYPSGKGDAQLIVNGTINITGSFGGSVSSTNSGAKIIVGSSATLSVTSKEGYGYRGGFLNLQFLFTETASITKTGKAKNSDSSEITLATAMTYTYNGASWA